jgi:hypothetical protein
MGNQKNKTKQKAPAQLEEDADNTVPTKAQRQAPSKARPAKPQAMIKKKSQQTCFTQEAEDDDPETSVQDIAMSAIMSFSEDPVDEDSNDEDFNVAVDGVQDGQSFKIDVTL